MLTKQQKTEIIDCITDEDDDLWEKWLDSQPEELKPEIREFVDQLFFPEAEPTPTPTLED